MTINLILLAMIICSLWKYYSLYKKYRILLRKYNDLITTNCNLIHHYRNIIPLRQHLGPRIKPPNNHKCKIGEDDAYIQNKLLKL